MISGTALARKTAVPSSHLGFWTTLKKTTRGPCGFGAGDDGVLECCGFLGLVVEPEETEPAGAEPVDSRPAGTALPAGAGAAGAAAPPIAPHPVSPVSTVVASTTTVGTVGWSFMLGLLASSVARTGRATDSRKPVMRSNPA